MLQDLSKCFKIHSCEASYFVTALLFKPYLFSIWHDFFPRFRYAVILAFDVKVERDAQEMADRDGIKIFQADIIYHLFDSFMKYREELKAKKREEFKHIAVFPCKLRIIPQYVFNARNPIVVGVQVEAGIVKEGTPIVIPSKEVGATFIWLGIVHGNGSLGHFWLSLYPQGASQWLACFGWASVP